MLGAARILQVACEALPLELRAGGGNEEPVRDGDREQQRRDAFQQLPTCTHASLSQNSGISNAAGAFCYRRTAMLLAKPGASKRRSGPGSSAGSH